MIRANKRTQSPELEVRLLRNGLGESVHRIHAVVCDDRSRPLSLAGDAETDTFIRSALKPFQALALLATGALDLYKLGNRDLAVVCGSHQGTPEHARQVFNILWQADIDPSALQCPLPANAQSRLQHNCSGKHAAMLAVCQQQHWPLNTYLNANAPVQQLILDKTAELLGMPGAEIIGAQDDCGAPTYMMQLVQMAALYAKLASGDDLYLERIVRAMTHEPEMVAGDGAFDTELMRLTAGDIVSKSGAEGIQCIGRVGEGMGLAIKALDGAKRAKYAAAIHLLRQLGWIAPEVAETLSDRFLILGDYKRLEVSGELTLL